MGTTRIECLDCGEPRDVPNASMHLVKRCKDCQLEFNRLRALQRYYERTGRKPKKKKKKEAKIIKLEVKEHVEEERPSHFTPGKTHNMSPKEKEKYFTEFSKRALGPNWDKNGVNIDDWT